MDFIEKISVLMPAYNEGHHIYHNLNETLNAFSRISDNVEIIVINDGSSDNTAKEVLRLKKKGRAPGEKIQLVDLKSNRGKGAALKEGFKSATGEIIVFLDSDLDLPPHQVEFLLDLMVKENADVIVGSKQHPLSKINYPKRRKFLSLAYSKVLHLLFGLPLKDTQTGLKLFRRKVLSQIFPITLSKTFAYDVEILAIAHHLKYRIVEAPVILNFRSAVRWGTISLRDYYMTANDTLAVFYRLRILRYYDRVLEGKIGKVSS